MGMVNGRQLQPSGPTATPRVIVRFRADMHGDADVAARSQSWTSLVRRIPTLRIVPLIAGASPSSRSEESSRMRSEAGERLRRYFAIEVPADADVNAIAQELQASPEVETAYVEPAPVPPPVVAADDPRSGSQGYLNAAPQGIDARFAWPSTDGFGVGFVDLEQGWTLNHEDLAGAGITLISGVNQSFAGHGTAVLGEIVAVDNTLGVVGIAPRAHTRVVSEWRTASTYSTAEAIASAAASMSSGDVLLLETQTTYGTMGNLPVEVYDATFDAIRAATDDGIIVVEAAGNGATDLNNFQTTASRRILDRNHTDFRDSGAIMVGAATSTVPHARSSFSNFGNRVDCFGWGDSIETCGDGGTGTGTTTYTSSFGGTSGASPMVAGAAVLVQSWRCARALPRVMPLVMRSLLSDPLKNTASQTPATDRVGVMPNLKVLIEEQERSARRGVFTRWAVVARVLFGVTNDGGGVIWVPGQGPIPIGPWTANMEEVTPEVRDMLASLAAFELSGLVEDDVSRTSLRRAAINAVKRNADQLLRH